MNSLETDEPPVSLVRAIFTVVGVLAGFCVFFLTFVIVPLILLVAFVAAYSLNQRWRAGRRVQQES